MSDDKVFEVDDELLLRASKRIAPQDRPAAFHIEARRVAPTCFHAQSAIDAGARVVQCVQCKASLDPITVLYKIAADATWVQSMRLEKIALTREIAALKLQLTSVRQKVKRATKPKETSR